jgi:hypothetical protein
VSKKENAKHEKRAARITRAAAAETITKHHAAMVDAVHEVLAKAGSEGLRVHSIRFEAAADFDGPCDPPCNDDTQRCVPESNGGHVTWVCVPR